MTSDHRLSLFEFLHAADRLLWSYRSAIDHNARARLTSDDLLLNDFCARAASRARSLLDDDLTRRSRGGGHGSHPAAGPDGDASVTASEGDGGEATGSAGVRDRCHPRRSHSAGMNKLHAAIQARRAAEARAAAAASSANQASSIATDEVPRGETHRDEPIPSADLRESNSVDGWEFGPDPFAPDPRDALPGGGGSAVRSEIGSNDSSLASPHRAEGGGSGWNSNPSRRRAPR